MKLQGSGDTLVDKMLDEISRYKDSNDDELPDKIVVSGDTEDFIKGIAKCTGSDEEKINTFHDIPIEYRDYPKEDGCVVKIK